MSIIRVQKNSNYSVISNVHLQDESLSWKAKGILSYLLSKPDDWQIYISHLKNQSTDGRDATASGIRELIETGYVTRDYTRNEAGQITGRDYVVHETALENKVTEKPVNGSDNPKTENPILDNPTLENPSLLNTDYTKYGLKENNDDVQEQVPADPCIKDSSSSFSYEKELITILAGLMALIPEQHRKPSVSKTLSKALNIHSVDYIRTSIAYTIFFSNGGTTQKFKAYLGKCIDLGWSEGWEPDSQSDQGNKEAIRDRFREMSEKDLRFLADAGNQLAIDELECRKILM